VGRSWQREVVAEGHGREHDAPLFRRSLASVRQLTKAAQPAQKDARKASGTSCSKGWQFVTTPICVTLIA
jgi:hypothetical protein